MRRKLFSSWLLLLSFSLTALGGCGGDGHSKPTDDVTEAITDAYAFSLPLVMMSVTLKNATNTVEPTGTKAPINQLHHAHALANADFREVVTPNVDTLYSQAFIDLKEGPLVFVKPAADRYCSAQFLDAWTNSVGIAGSGGEGNAEQEQVWLLMRNDDTQTEVPPGMRAVRFSSSIGWIIGRTLCKGEEDIPNVQAIQERMRLIPLAYLDKGEWTPPQGTYDSRYDYVPVERVKKMTPAEFFDEANSLMRDNPPVSADRLMLDRIRSVGVGADLTFDPAVLGKDTAEREATWKRVVDGLGQRMKQVAEKFIVRDGAWEYLGEPIGEFGTEYDYRAMVALKGFGANPVSAALYASAHRDSDGKPLEAGGHYRLRFEKGALPPMKTDGFWSVTAYNDEDFLIPNPLNRYAVNDRSPLVFNEDGSLDFLLQPEAPEEDNPLKVNWLPTGNGKFHLFMRIYCPDKESINQGWTAPKLVREK